MRTGEKAAPGQLGRWLRRSAGILDAGVSSVGNLAVSVVAAHALPLGPFGLVSTSMLTGIVVVGLSRAVFGDPLVLSASALDAADHRRSARRSLAAALAGSVLVVPVLAVLLTGIVVLARGDVSTGLWLGLALAVGTPGLVVQELQRATSYSGGRPFAAVANSATWTGLLLAGLAFLTLGPRTPGPAAFVAVWGISAAAGALVGVLVNRVSVGFGGLRGWTREHAALIRRLLADYGLTEAQVREAFEV